MFSSSLVACFHMVTFPLTFEALSLKSQATAVEGVHLDPSVSDGRSSLTQAFHNIFGIPFVFYDAFH